MQEAEERKARANALFVSQLARSRNPALVLINATEKHSLAQNFLHHFERDSIARCLQHAQNGTQCSMERRARES